MHRRRFCRSLSCRFTHFFHELVDQILLVIGIYFFFHDLFGQGHDHIGNVIFDLINRFLLFAVNIGKRLFLDAGRLRFRSLQQSSAVGLGVIGRRLYNAARLGMGFLQQPGILFFFFLGSSAGGFGIAVNGVDLTAAFGK